MPTSMMLHVRHLALVVGLSLGLLSPAAEAQAGGAGSGSAPGSGSSAGAPSGTLTTANIRLDLGLTHSPPPGTLSQPYFQPTRVRGAFEVVIPTTPTGFTEKFMIQLPLDLSYADFPVPLLVYFHEFGATHASVIDRTEILTEAAQRKWIVLSPLGASKKHYGSLESQANMELAIAYLLGVFGPRIDLERVYGVGFSMGGGAMLSFAARHQANNQLGFAALVNHTGNAALKSVWTNEGPAIKDVLTQWFGGSPVLFPYAYERCSTIDYDELTQSVFTDTDMARNLTHLPIRHLVATNDPLAHLVTATEVLHGHLSSLGAPSELVTVFSSQHSWDNLDPAATLDWLSQFTRPKPTEGRALADRSANFFGFNVEQQASGEFTPFDWAIDTAANRIELSGSDNLKSWRVNLPTLGLSATPGSVLEVHSQSTDGTGDEVELVGLSGPPLAVSLNGSSTSAFTWDSATKVLTLDGGGGGLGSTFVILP